jgi:hypothetical protein
MELLSGGGATSIREAARGAGISNTTVRRALAALGKIATAELEQAGLTSAGVGHGLQAIRSTLLTKMAERLSFWLANAKPSELRNRLLLASSTGSARFFGLNPGLISTNIAATSWAQTFFGAGERGGLREAPFISMIGAQKPRCYCGSAEAVRVVSDVGLANRL